MARALTVPRRYQNGLAKIRDLEEDSTQELLAAIQEIHNQPPTIDQSVLASTVAGKVDTIAIEDVDAIVPALLSLYTFKDDPQFSAMDVAEGMARGMEEVPSKELRSSPEAREHFRDRLLELLNVEALTVIARAGGLLLENEHSLREARIITDVRPVFSLEAPQSPPDGALIVHTLKISYWADNEVKNFYVALDTSDVSDLSEQLERASLKSESLKSVLKSTDISYIDAE